MRAEAPQKVLKETHIQIYERGADVGGTWRVSLCNRPGSRSQANSTGIVG